MVFHLMENDRRRYFLLIHGLIVKGHVLGVSNDYSPHNTQG